MRRSRPSSSSTACGRRRSAVHGAVVWFRAVLPTGTVDLDQDRLVTGAADTSSWRSTGGHDLGSVAVPYADDCAPTPGVRANGAGEGQSHSGERFPGRPPRAVRAVLSTLHTSRHQEPGSGRSDSRAARTRPRRGSHCASRRPRNARRDAAAALVLSLTQRHKLLTSSNAATRRPNVVQLSVTRG
jgi:hypothetical protein